MALARVPDAIYDQAKKLVRDGAIDEVLINFLKENNISAMSAVTTLQRLRSIPLIEAKSIVSSSSAYSDDFDRVWREMRDLDES